jgi:hypothetical protein
MANLNKFHHDGKGNIKEHEDAPVKSGESVYSTNLWNKIASMEKLDVEEEKGKTEKAKVTLKESKLVAKLAKSVAKKDKPVIEEPIVKKAAKTKKAAL